MNHSCSFTDLAYSLTDLNSLFVKITDSLKDVNSVIRTKRLQNKISCKISKIGIKTHTGVSSAYRDRRTIFEQLIGRKVIRIRRLLTSDLERIRWGRCTWSRQVIRLTKVYRQLNCTLHPSSVYHILRKTALHASSYVQFILLHHIMPRASYVRDLSVPSIEHVIMLN
ncbi:unnamed protein product [Brugia pahangi]|uniref:Endonuclease-reverse transcriptase n=1 Tax=Brugia pahangi TaxID=6280 RepID=A0A0N4TQK8_BRUPA|nr:unnamed protein product [Brugia pahangi]